MNVRDQQVFRGLSPNIIVVNYNMKQIELSQGKFALVDDEDYEELNKWKWYAAKHRNTFYAQRTDRTNGKKTVKMHRFILGITDINILTDHADGDGLNNQRNNIRKATGSQNMWNRRPNKNSTSKYIGVSFDKDKRRKKWKAMIAVNNKSICLGRFFTEEEAHEAYKQKAIELHGEFASHSLKLKDAV